MILNSRFCGASVVTMLALYGVVQVPNVVVSKASHERMGRVRGHGEGSTRRRALRNPLAQVAGKELLQTA